jgi:hypothetical protein
MKSRKFDRAAAMRTMTTAEAVQAAPVVCDGDDWLMSNEPPAEECIGYDDDGQPVYVPQTKTET